MRTQLLSFSSHWLLTFGTPLPPWLCGKSGIPHLEFSASLKRYAQQLDSGFAAKRNRALIKRSATSSSRAASPAASSIKTVATSSSRATSPSVTSTKAAPRLVQSALSVLPVRPRSADDAKSSETSSITARRTSARNNPAAVIPEYIPDTAWKRRTHEDLNYLAPLFSNSEPWPIPVIVRAPSRPPTSKERGPWTSWNSEGCLIRVSSFHSHGHILHLLLPYHPYGDHPIYRYILVPGAVAWFVRVRPSAPRFGTIGTDIRVLLLSEDPSARPWLSNLRTDFHILRLCSLPNPLTAFRLRRWSLQRQPDGECERILGLRYYRITPQTNKGRSPSCSYCSCRFAVLHGNRRQPRSSSYNALRWVLCS